MIERAKGRRKAALFTFGSREFTSRFGEQCVKPLSNDSTGVRVGEWNSARKWYPISLSCYRYKKRHRERTFELCARTARAVRRRPADCTTAELHPFFHGICLSDLDPTTAATWETTKTFLIDDLHWSFGGSLAYNPDEDPRTLFPAVNNFIPRATFYTATFGNCQANYFFEDPFTHNKAYFGRLGLLHQADEVRGFIRELTVSGNASVNIVAHSMGGMAARSYIADNPEEATSHVRDFITYGTPHWGARFSSLLRGFSDGANDLDFDCDFDILSGRSTLDYSRSAFFEHLHQIPLPNLRYTNIRGTGVTDPVTLGCLSAQTDLIIPIDSADLVLPTQAPINQPALVLKRTLITTDRLHTNQTSDFSAILCALDLNCEIYRTHSPVDMQITAPDGRTITNELTEIPGASYTAVPEDGGGTSATVILPFPQSGAYSVKVVPKPGAAPTDTYSLDVTRAGVTTVLAQDQTIQSIPAQPFIIPVLAPLSIDIKPGSNPNSIKLASDGKTPVAILSTADFDAPSRIDASTLTFGHFGDERSLAFCNPSGEDVNGDGFPDLVCHFFTQAAGFIENDTVGTLKGRTKAGVPFVGTDSVRIIR